MPHLSSGWGSCAVNRAAPFQGRPSPLIRGSQALTSISGGRPPLVSPAGACLLDDSRSCLVDSCQVTYNTSDNFQKYFGYTGRLILNSPAARFADLLPLLSSLQPYIQLQEHMWGHDPQQKSSVTVESLRACDSCPSSHLLISDSWTERVFTLMVSLQRLRWEHVRGWDSNHRHSENGKLHELYFLLYYVYLLCVCVHTPTGHKTTLGVIPLYRVPCS